MARKFTALRPSDGIHNLNGREPSVESKFVAARRIAKLAPFRTTHELVLGDARRMATVASNSVHLVVTSPPYFDLVAYNDSAEQLGHIHSYERFLGELDAVWRECFRVLIPGGKLCIVVGDVCRSRRQFGTHEVIPLHADILVRLRKMGLETVATILWQKIANAAREVSGRGAALGKPYEPNNVVKNDVEFVLRLRKPGPYRQPTPLQRAGSIIPRDEFHEAMRQVWTDLPGASRRSGHPAPFPVSIARRLMLLHSYVEDTVLDPFVGSGSTTIAAAATHRNSIGYEIDPAYAEIAKRRIRAEAPTVALVVGSGSV